MFLRTSRASLLTAALLLASRVTPAQAVGDPPDVPGPTSVDFAVYLHDLTQVDSTRQVFTADIMVSLRWHDPRLADPSAAGLRSLEGKDVWHPKVVALNQLSVSSGWPELLEVTPAGQVSQRMRLIGEFSSPLDFTDFPFDRQRLRLRFCSGTYDEHQVRFDGAALADRTGLSRTLALPDWQVGAWSVEVGSPRELPGEVNRAGFELALELERGIGYYLTKVILPLALIVFMSWIVFWIDPREIGSQIGVATTSMLTLIAYRFSLDQLVPPVSYLTRLDVFVLGSTVLVFLSLIEVTLTSRHAMHGRLEAALRLDRASRVLFPLLFVALALWAFAAPS
ncbi:MAG: hypothetical protein ABL998_06450 [Planctomycetota bacterium]